MNINRRTMILSGAAFSAMTAFRAHAQITVGNTRIDTLSDGNLVVPRAMTLGAHADDAEPILSRYGISGDTLRPDCNLTLVRDGTNTVLFDAGGGTAFMPTTGKIIESLETLGIAPEDVTHVVFTHAHPDHLWGVLDDFDEPWFYNAVHMIGRTERDYWLNPNTPDTIGQERMAFAAGAVRYLGALEDRLEVFDANQEILPGIASVASYGHTPGHMSFQVGNDVMIIGDAIGNHHTAFEAPAWLSGMDQDQDTGVTSRTMLLDRLSAEKKAAIGYHFPFPGIGYVEKNANGYRFVPG